MRSAMLADVAGADEAEGQEAVRDVGRLVPAVMAAKDDEASCKAGYSVGLRDT